MILLIVLSPKIPEIMSCIPAWLFISTGLMADLLIELKHFFETFERTHNLLPSIDPHPTSNFLNYLLEK